jgi:hypothetical protein
VRAVKRLAAVVVVAALDGAACGRTQIDQPVAVAIVPDGGGPAQPPACDGGACAEGGAAACTEPLVVCAGACVDPGSSREHCGARGDCAGANAGAACAPGEICAAGACVLTCQAGLVACAGTCVDPAVSREHCGARGDCAGANAGAACASDEICAAGRCAPPPCDTPHLLCGGACVDAEVDPANCGGCGRACAAGEACVRGACVEARRCTDPVAFYDDSDPQDIGVSAAALAGDSAGNVLMSWDQFSVGSFVTRFDPATLAWSPRTKIDLGSASRVAIGGAGGLGLLVMLGASANGFEASIPDPVSGAWGAPIGIAFGEDFHPASVDGFGNRIVVGRANDGRIFATVFDPVAGAFDPPDAVSTADASVASTALDEAGRLHATIKSVVDGVISVQAVRFDETGRPAPADPPFGTFAVDPGQNCPGVPLSNFALASDGDGNAIATWDDTNYCTGHVAAHFFARRFDDAAASWADVALSFDATPAVGLGPGGAALLVWQHPTATGGGLAASAFAGGGAGWSAAVAPIAGAVVAISNVAMNARGDGAVAVLATTGIWLCRFDGGARAWRAPQLVVSMSTTSMLPLHFFVDVTLADGGTAVVLWRGDGYFGPPTASYCR